MSLATPAEVKAWANTTLDSTRDAELTRCIAAAQSWIEAQTGRVLEAATFTTRLTGDDADPLGNGNEALWLPAAHRPVQFPGTGGGTFVLKECGSTIGTVASYSTTAGAWLVNANQDRRAMVVRAGEWTKDVPLSVEVTYTAGYDGTTLVLPARMKQLIYEVAWLFFVSPGWIGKSHSTGDGGVTFEKELTPQSRGTLAEMRSGGVVA